MKINSWRPCSSAGGHLRLSEGLRLRVKDLVFDYDHICVRDGKSGKDRTTVLPDRIREPPGAEVLLDRFCAAL